MGWVSAVADEWVRILIVGGARRMKALGWAYECDEALVLAARGVDVGLLAQRDQAATAFLEWWAYEILTAPP
jgi:hypothetical protein